MLRRGIIYALPPLHPPHNTKMRMRVSELFKFTFIFYVCYGLSVTVV